MNRPSLEEPIAIAFPIEHANPLFDKAPQRVAPAHQNWVNQFDLVSPLSSFSPEIKVPTQTYFYCGKAQGIVRRSTTPFDIFTWSNGKWQMATFMVDFGDPIGGIDGGVDYSTGYTYVDKQTRGNKSLITLVDRQGNVRRPRCIPGLHQRGLQAKESVD